MIAVFKHELKNYFHSFTAYVFGAFLLAIVGIGAMLYNLQAAVSNFEYVLSFGMIIFVVIVPILTMRVIAEERKQKTDQLLYSLPHIYCTGNYGKISGASGSLFDTAPYHFHIPAHICPVWRCLSAYILWVFGSDFYYGSCIGCLGSIHFFSDR